MPDAPTPVAVLHCPECHAAIGSVRLYSGRKSGRPEGASDLQPRKERRGDFNKALAKAMQDGS